MQLKTVIVSSVMIWGLAGCAAQDPAQPGTDACGASTQQSLIGQALSDVTIPSTQDVRIIKPDTLVTLDYVPTRMNIKVGNTGLIETVYCG
ncbi:I78 family peptidase inhibitor [Oceaniglobus ichthyenteri]|uniref:I78 family peptidase inhibitor n=1 Tax=Oceaniglobus ichthyenteri TaxID=2136177 RepID=UPI0013DE58D1|nr:I78 family peptidase inhibitor [Oceaniglobus ichthyenteri]